MKILTYLIVLLYFIPNLSIGMEKKKFFSTKYNKVNVRIGPGIKYFVTATFLKKGIPLIKIRSFDNWEEIKDIDGNTGWISKTQLSKKRFATVIRDKSKIYQYPNYKSKLLYFVHKNVILRILRCRKEWCEIEVNKFRGWINKNFIWGVNENEVF